ncbi:unnamed protein product [Urochloa humidicola]
MSETQAKDGARAVVVYLATHANARNASAHLALANLAIEEAQRKAGLLIVPIPPNAAAPAIQVQASTMFLKSDVHNFYHSIKRSRWTTVCVKCYKHISRLLGTFRPPRALGGTSVADHQRATFHWKHLTFKGLRLLPGRRSLSAADGLST